MLRSKAIEILKAFSADEIKQFRDFVNSPFHNSNKNVIKLFEMVRKHYPEFKSNSLEKEKLFSKLYPGKKYSDIVMRILISDLIKLSEEFLTQNGLKGNIYEANKLLLQELNVKGLDSLYMKKFREAYTDLENFNDMRSRFLKMFEYEMNYVDYHLQRSKQHEICSNVLNRTEYLFCFFILEFAGNLHDLVINEKTFNAKFEFNIAYEFINSFDFKGILKKMKESGFKYYPIILLHYNLINAVLNETDEKAYEDFKYSVFENYERLGKHEGYNFLNNLETCCLNRRKYNSQKYMAESYEIYQYMLKNNNYSYYGDQMGFQRFKNFLTNFINLKKFEEAENFVNKYIDKVEPDLRENLYNYSFALIRFSKKDFLNSLEYLQKVKHNYLILKYDVKNLNIKIFYELDYADNLFSQIDSYKHFLSKNTSVSEFFKERYNNFVSIVNLLYRLKSEKASTKTGSDFQLEKVLFKIQETGNIVSKDWLLEKANELMY